MTGHGIGLGALALNSKTDLPLPGAIVELLAAVMHCDHANSVNKKIAEEIIKKS